MGFLFLKIQIFPDIMKLRLCANIDLNSINIGENMKPEIKAALALELTKARITNKDPLDFKITSADLWVETYEQSVKDINKAEYDYCLKANSQPSSVFD